MFLRIYIRAFQHASDLSEAVEEKLLIGDRPKQPADPECTVPLDERLEQRKTEELAEVGSFHRFTVHIRSYSRGISCDSSRQMSTPFSIMVKPWETGSSLSTITPGHHPRRS